MSTTNNSNKKTRTKRTNAQKKEILDYAEEHGPMDAEKKFGVNRSLIHKWRGKLKSSAAGETTKKLVDDVKAAQDRIARTKAARVGGIDQMKSKKAGIKALRYATVLDTLANEALANDNAEEALALFAGASALRGKLS